MKHITTYQNYKLLLESLVSAKARFGDQLNDDDFNWLASLDPTPTKKYTEKICDWFLYGYDINNIQKSITTYNDLVNKNLVDIKDINQFKSFNDFLDYVKINKDNVSKAEQAKRAKEGSMVIFEDNKWLLLRIKTKEASCLYGKGTKWCITMKDQHYWENYNNDSIFYFIINKTLSPTNKWYKVAAQVEKSKITFWDAEDKKHNLANFTKVTNFPLELLNHLKFIPFDWDNSTLEEKLNKLEINNYTINSNGTVDVFDDVFLIFNKLIKLPIKFGKILGNFNCSNNKLKSLEGCPQEVSGDFNCSNNKLKSLEGCPQKVGKDFNCVNNQLTSLKGVPQEIRGDFYCANNKLKSLEGCPQKVSKSFGCNSNQLTSLKGGPQEVGGYYYCYSNQLTSLEGAPQKVGASFDCSVNQLTSLKGAPEKVGGNFDCSGNKLTSLKGGPQEVGKSFNCYNNRLTSLKGAPQKVGGGFDCSSNYLTSLKGAPQKVGASFDCSVNKLITLEGGPQEVGKNFRCSHNSKRFYKSEVSSLCNVGGLISTI